MDDFHRVRDYLTSLQDRICRAIETADGPGAPLFYTWRDLERGTAMLANLLAIVAAMALMVVVAWLGWPWRTSSNPAW